MYEDPAALLGLDFFWLRDERLEDPATFPAPMFSSRKSPKTSKSPSKTISANRHRVDQIKDVKLLIKC
jgi:hypothetical protein